MTFSLAGLLRVRGAQERVAAEDLARASVTRDRAEAARRIAAAELSGLNEASARIDDAATLLAMAAARSAGRTALSDLQVLAQLSREAESEAKEAHVQARRELRGIERLESAHRLAEIRSDLAAEQVALDEIGTARGRRPEGSAA